MVHVVAFDAAGNETESEKVRFYIIHRPEEEEEEETGDESGAIWWRDQDRLTLLSGGMDAVAWRPPLVPAYPSPRGRGFG